MKRWISLLLAVWMLTFAIPVWAAPVTDTLDVTVHKATVKPVIDGKLSNGEWGEAVMYQEPGKGYTYFPDEDGGISAEAVTAYIYMLWDKDGYYVAASVEDETHFNQYTGLDIWNGDAFEFDSNFNTEDYTDRNRQCYGMNNDGDIYGGSYKVASSVVWAENSEIQYEEYTVSRDGTTTIYEFFVPWDNFCPDGADFAKEGNRFRGNVQFHLALDGDYVGCQRYVQMDGESAVYPNFILAGEAVSAVEEVPTPQEPEVLTDAPAAEPTETEITAAPQTADAALIPATLAIICTVTIILFAVHTKRARI